MNYQQTIDYMYRQLPMFHRVGANAFNPSLTKIKALCNVLGDPHLKFKSIHVGGTNGKGSSSHMLAAILQKAGYKTGLYTSPHLKDFRERIRINGKMILKKEVITFIKKYRNEFEEIKPSFFEMTVALAFDHFAREHVDIAVIEVGLGGRLDSTNIITPVLSLITNIGYDHVEILGNTLEKIAFEKAGIIKPHIPVIISQTQKETANIFKEQAYQNKSPIFFADQLWNISQEKKSSQEHFINLKVVNFNKTKELLLKLDLIGAYQLKNIKGVLQSIYVLNEKKVLHIDNQALLAGLKQVKKLTGLKGRWYTLSKQPHIICDTGHNEDGIKEILTQLATTPYKNLHWVFGIVNDKDTDKILALLPKHATYYFCKASIPRAMNEKNLQKKASCFKLHGKSFSTVKEALSNAKRAAKTHDLILVGGSTFVVAEII